MANFTDAIKIILKHEGGYVNDPLDPGGETNYGISKRAFPNEDIRNLTIAKAEAIYKNFYWLPVNGNNINHQMLATNIFDFAVNAGVLQCIRLLQNLLDVKVDGIMGSNTINTLNSKDGDKFNILFTKERYAFYKNIVFKKPTLNKFLKGWKIRCEHFAKLEE